MRKNLHSFHLLLILTFFLFNSNGYSQTFPSKDSLQNLISGLKESHHVKALIGGIWKGDQEILTLALGESMTSVPAEINMHLRTGGVTETFFGTLLMILVDKGFISPDDKISKWLPDLLDADKVTPEMLIKNTAGYKDYVLNKDFINLILKEPFRKITREEIINYSTGDGKMNFEPGTKQQYSHTEFTILGEVLERATGKTMGELYQEYIFRPLNLDHTGHCLNADLPFPVLHAFSSARGIYEDATFWNPSWVGESGPIYSNLADLAKWARVFGKGILLTPASFEKLISRPPGAASPDMYFASGFGVVNGWYIQNPSFNGFSGGFGYLPSRELTVIIYTTESEDPKSGAQAIKILEDIVKVIAPGNEVSF